MRIAGVIVEYNPFHAGHAWQIAQLRALGYDAIVCVCSPSVVQRGTVAQFPCAVRTRAALAGGADIVLSLPAPYAACSAEGFARAGVHLLASLGVCEVVAFGAETPDVELLCQTARMLRTQPFAAVLKTQLARGISFAAAREKAAEQCLTGSGAVLSQPNNILGVEYCKAILSLQERAENSALCGNIQTLQPLALPRMGAEHDAPLLQTDSAFASASALRALVQKHGVASLACFVPPTCMQVYLEAERAGQVLNETAFATALLSRLRAKNAADFAQIRGVSEGVENRLLAASLSATDTETLYAAMKTKRYAHARMRRLALDAALGYPATLPTLPPYLHVLGASQTGELVLKKAKKTAALPLSASLSDLRKESAPCAHIADAHAAAEDFAALCWRTPTPCGTAFSNAFQKWKNKV